ncbi:MAG: tetratricopeptide repeat protein [Spirochaetia bacterium]|jgi:tetratricopeptide (TPR) repeat protein
MKTAASVKRFACILALLCSAVALFAADARSAYLAGMAAQGSEEYELAIEKYKEALALNPAYLDPMVGLAESFFQLEEYDEAYTFVSMARIHDQNNPDLAVLEGRIRIGQGSIAAARALFTQVLARQPNNVEAQLGIAEAEIAEGKPQNAMTQYAQTLKLAPESTKAMLSLAMLYDETGDSARAGAYYELALAGHSSDPVVQLSAASWYAASGSFTTAEKHAQIALSLKPQWDRAKILLGGIFLQTSRYADAIAALKDVVSSNRDDPVAWYSLGLAYRKSGDPARAISSFTSALHASADDEVARIAQEGTAVESLPIGDAQRVTMAGYHVAQGKAFEDRSYLERALAEYRRALILDPVSRDARVAYARIYRSLGFPGKYLSELQVLAKLGVKDTFVSDEIERLTSVLMDSVSQSWGFDQYNLERARFTIPVYTIAAGNRLVHPLASDDVARYFASLLGRYDAISVPDSPAAAAGFDQAFSAARGASTDYFLILAVDEAARSFSATADLYLSRTGARIASFDAFRTGNDRVRDSLMKLAGQIAGLMPVRGTLLVRKFGEGAIDIGTFQGVKKGDSLVIVRKGGVRLRPDAPGLIYDDRDVIGDFRVTGVDEAVSQGTVTGRGYFDYINAGDQVLFAVQKKAPPTVPPSQRTGNILTRLFRLGG